MIRSEIAIPVYTPKDYPLFRDLPGADDLPATWELWCEQFNVWQHLGWQQFGLSFAHKVWIRPDRFQLWAQARSLDASPSVRQRYAQFLLDERTALKAQAALQAQVRVRNPDVPEWVDRLEASLKAFRDEWRKGPIEPRRR